MEREYKVQTRFLFHTNIKIKIPDSFENKVFDELFEILEDVNKNYNSYSKNSYIDKINKNNGKFVQVNEETVNLLEKVVHFSEIMNGEYDITIMPLIKLWGFYKENSENISIEDADKYLSRIVLEKSEIKICVSNHYEDEEELEFTIKAENGKYFTNQDLIFQIQRYLTEKIDFTKIFSSKICISVLRLSIDRDKYYLFWDCV